MPLRRPRAPTLERGSVRIGGVERSYLLAPPSRPSSPLLVALHGLGMSAGDMDAFSGLARRGPAAGFATVFPDGWHQRWVATPTEPDRVHVDDPGFITALVARLVADGVAREGGVVLAGISNGAVFAEFLARHAVVRVSLLALVAGSAREDSRASCPRPLQSSSVVCFAGTADRAMPYGGGVVGPPGVLGRIAERRAGRHRGAPRPVVAPIEVVAAEWAAANGVAAAPSVEEVAGQTARLPVTKLCWSAPRCPTVTVYRIEGGGHGWPGGPQYLPGRLIGSITQTLDATGVLLALAADAP